MAYSARDNINGGPEKIKRSSSSRRKISSYKYRDSFFKSDQKPRRDNSTNFFTDRVSLMIKDNRLDAFGTPIKKGGKKHKVTFIDELKKTGIAEISEFQDCENLSPKGDTNKYIINTKKVSDSKVISYSNNTNYKNFSKENGRIKERGEDVKCKACSIF